MTKPPSQSRKASGNTKKSSTTKRSSSTSNPKPSKVPRTVEPATTGSTNAGPVRIVNSITPVKSPNDPNEYRVIKLSNGLTVALISRKSPHDVASNSSSSKLNLTTDCSHFNRPAPFDLSCSFTTETETDFIGYTFDDDTAGMHKEAPRHQQTSITLVVNIGGHNDPSNCQGLAHLTEHLMHYGSKKFPEEDAVKTVVVNFGTYNATTMPYTTNYYNQVPDIVLEKNLDLFSSMLTQPLFRLDVLNREVNAVDSEFYLRLPMRRKYLLQPHVIIKSKSHPLTRFICGSLETLGGGREGERIQRQMKENHQNNYVATAMTLALNSTKSLDELERLTLHHFSSFPPGSRSIYAKTPAEETPKLEFEEGNVHVYLEGFSRSSELSLVWHVKATPWMRTEERVLPFILHIFSDTSSTSLCYYLKSKELIWFMYPRGTSTVYATFLELNFFLTKKGSQNTNQIIEATFDFLNFLMDKSLEPEMSRLFDEIRIDNLREFHFGNQRATLGTTKDLAMRLQYIDNPADLLLSDTWHNSRFNFKSVQGMLALLKNENLFVFETLKEGVNIEEKGRVQVAPYTGARYVVQKRNKNVTGDKNSRLRFRFVPANRYLAQDVSKMRNSRNSGEGGDWSGIELESPVNVGDIKPQRLNWRSQDDLPNSESTPKISGVHRGHSTISENPFYSMIHIGFSSNYSLNPTSRNRALGLLWTCVVFQSVGHIISEVKSAGFYFRISPWSGIMLSVGGFPRRIEEIATILISHMFKDITPTIFSLAKEQLIANWESNLSESDWVTYKVLDCIIFEDAWMSIDLLGTLEEITLQDLNNFIKAFQLSAFAVVELQGNISLKAFETIASYLDKMPFAPKLDNNPRAYNNRFSGFNPDFYSLGETCVRLINHNSKEYTTSVTNVYTLVPTNGREQREADYFSAAMYFMRCRAFMILRTKEQLGYVVNVRQIFNQGEYVPYMMFSVNVTSTSRKYAPCELDQRIDQFLADYGEYLKSMPSELFETMLKLTSIPNDIIQSDVANWFQEKFSQNFGRVDIKMKCLLAGIKKISIQVLPGNSDNTVKICSCPICASIGEKSWQRGNSTGSGFSFARSNSFTKDYFLVSPKF